MSTAFKIQQVPVRGHDGDMSGEIGALVAERIRTFFGEAGGDRDGVVVTLSLQRPLFDERLVRRMIEICARERRPVRVEGAAGGTAPLSVEWPGSEAPPHILFWESQFDHNVQLEINRMKRLKIFMALVRRYPGFHTRPLAEILDFLGSAEGTEFVLAYGEEVQLDRYENCPNCGNEALTPVRPGNSQPRIGYLTRASRYYHHCGACNLVFLNPVMPEEELHRLYDWYDKEGATATLTAADFQPEAMHRASYYQNFVMALDKLGPRLPADARTLDLGGGAGWFAVLAKRRFPGWDVGLIDFDCRHVEALLAGEGVAARSMDILNGDHPREAYDLVTMFEVMEHLRVERLKTIWSQVHAMLKPGGYFLFSTPDFDSDFARATDFWVAYVPHHVTVLSFAVLQPMWEAAGFELVDRDARSLLFREGYGDFAYGAANHASIAARAEAAIMDRFLHLSDAKRALYNWMDETRSGGEMIVILRKTGDAVS